MLMPNHKTVETLRAKVARLESEIAHDIYVELAILPKQFGFSSVAHFLRAVEKAATGARKKRGRKKVVKAAKPRRRKRAKITDAIRAKVKKLVKAEKTGSQIAKAVGISLPSVQNIKKALGLIRVTKKSVTKPKTRRAKTKPSAAPKSRKKRLSRKRDSALEGTPVHQLPIETMVPPG